MSGFNVFPDDYAVTVWDYIDGDGDMLSLDVVDKQWLAVSIMSRGQKTILTSIIDVAADARKMAAHLLDWADTVDSK